MQLEDTLLSLLYDSFNMCVHCMCKANSPETNDRLILLQTHVEYRTSLSPSTGNKTLQPLTCESIERNVYSSAVAKHSDSFPSTADNVTAFYAFW